MIVFERAVRFEEVDPASIVFFGRFSEYAHEAMEHFFCAIEGGYPGLIVKRRIGLPAVRFEAKFFAPLRYGDRVRIETAALRIGNRSATLRYRMFRVADGALSAEVEHTVVTTDLVTLKSCDMPADVRRVLEENLEQEGAAT